MAAIAAIVIGLTALIIQLCLNLEARRRSGCSPRPGKVCIWARIS